MHTGGAMILRRPFALLLFVMLLSVALSGCVFGDGGPGEVRQRNLNVPNDGARSVRYVIRHDVGALAIEGGADGLLAADLTYNDRLDPAIEHDADSDPQVVTIEQPSSDGRNGEDWDQLPYRASDNLWQVQFSDDVLAEIELYTPRTRLETDFASVPVRRLSVTGDERMSTVGLDGVQPDLSVVQVASRAGAVWLNMEGTYGAIETIDITTRSGDVTLVMLGEWLTDADASVTTISGPVTLYLPEDLAVEIDAVTANGKIAQNGFRREGDLWVNDAWGTTNVTLHLKVTTGSGDIAFRTEPRSEGE